MLIIGLTGSIASGKSYALRIFSRMGVRVFSADAAVHEILVSESKVKKAIFAHFPAIKNKEGNIMRDKLAQQVYGRNSTRENEEHLRWLERLLHPRVQASFERYICHCRRIGARIIVAEIPLLFETNLAKNFDYIVMTFAPKALRKKRAFKRISMTQAQWRSICMRQTPDFKKRAWSDSVIVSGLGRAHGMRSVFKALYRCRNKKIYKV